MNKNYGPFRRTKLMGIMVTYFYFIFKLLIYINFFCLTTMLSFFPMVVLSTKWRRFFYPRMHGAHFVVWLSSSWIKILEEKLCSGVVNISVMVNNSTISKALYFDSVSWVFNCFLLIKKTNIYKAKSHLDLKYS